MKILSMIVVLLALAGVAVAAETDERWTAEIRVGAALPTGDLGESELDAGFGFEGTVGYRFREHLSVYAGWDWMRFGAEQDTDVEETGYAFGLRFVHPLREGGDLRYLVRLGGTYDHIEVEDADGAIVADSGHGLGWEVGAGLVVPVGARWDLTPGVRYRALSRDLDTSAGEASVDLTYVAVEVGIARRF